MALLDQCTCGGVLEGEFIRKRSHFQGSHVLHHLQKLCTGGHKHLNLRGKGRAAAAARYPEQECEWIVLDAQTTGVSEGGRILHAQMSWDEKVKTLQSIPKDKGLTQVWDNIVHPWLHEDSSNPPKAENETCDADADEEPPPRPRSRESRKK